jgi:SAM-dependent methyltransferase
MPVSRGQREVMERFRARHTGEAAARRAVELEALGFPGAAGYTTRPQVDRLARVLGLRDGMRVLDLGAGAGWPSVYLAARVDAEFVLADLPVGGIARARKRAFSEGVAGRCRFAHASGTRLPFRPRSFDAILHTDVLC